MEHKLKALVESITHDKLKKLVISHVTELAMENNHLIVYVDNAEPLHELNLKSMDDPMKKALEKVFDPSITYEYRLMHAHEKPDHMGKNPNKRSKH